MPAHSSQEYPTQRHQRRREIERAIDTICVRLQHIRQVFRRNERAEHHSTGIYDIGGNDVEHKFWYLTFHASKENDVVEMSYHSYQA
jgi:hypothetical protein